MKKILTLLTLLITGSFIVHSQENLEIEGAIIIKESEASNPEEGTIQWDGTDFLFWNGVRWVSLTNYSTVGTVSDIDGTIYQTVRIGDQIWMAENLRTKTYNDNSDIPEVTDNSTWGGLTTDARCWYNNDPSNDSFFYNWHAVNTDKLCPTGWHVPTDSEWDILAEHLGGTSIAGGKMKEIGTANWATPNTGASNESGFTSKPAGFRLSNGAFSAVSITSSPMWSSTEVGNNAFARNLIYNKVELFENESSKRFGFSVRCVQD